MKNTKKTFTVIFTLLISLAAWSREAVYIGDDYDISLNYNDTAYPGDAVFLRMKFSQSFKKNRIPKNEFHSTTAQADFIVDGKTVRKAGFYPLSKDGKTITFLTGIPLSSWWKDDSDYSIKIFYEYPGSKKMEFTLPFKMESKRFIEETLELDDGNTAIKTDTSTKRMEQIKKLNELLQTTKYNSVYSTKNFVRPTVIDRQTSFFADRRIYSYTTGKSSTGLHYGIDYGVPEGTEVTACSDGKIVMAEERISTGWSIVIEHLPGLYSLYYHLSEMNVKEGDSVKQGQQIGRSGCTGLATGPHLHWEVRLNNEAVNPEFFYNNFTFEPVPGTDSH